MKADIHPKYNFAVFRDVSVGVEFLTRTTMKTREKMTVGDEEVALINIDISSASHPFYTGQQKLLDTEGRVERFRRKYGFGPEEPSGT